ncbi:AmmeMemoRadiSam system protein B [Nannocystaceae bacterium ST9]
MAVRIRPPAVAGRFYPAEPRELAAMVDALLAEVAEPEPSHAKALIVPHAGYVYSGPVAASAYARLIGRAASITKVVLLGPAHRIHLDGLALPSVAAFRTPLGDVAIDRELVERAAELAQVVVSDEAHRDEHSLEVQLPFLQRVLPSFALLPVVVGRASPAAVAELLERVWGGDETLILISSDLSHYHGYAEAQTIDRATAAWIVASERPGLDHRRACGASCIDGLIELARRKPGRFQRELIDLRSSGDTAGPRDQVVGYGAFAVEELAC